MDYLAGNVQLVIAILSVKTNVNFFVRFYARFCPCLKFVFTKIIVNTNTFGHI